MATPKEMVDERLTELGMSKTDFARKLGYASYQGYYDLFSGQRTQLTDEKLAQIAEVLKWPRDHFKAPGRTAQRAEYIRKEFNKYLEHEVGRDALPETHRILESMQWTGDLLPSKELYIAVTIAMEGRYTAAQVADALKLEVDDAVRTAKPDETQTRKAAPRKRSP